MRHPRFASDPHHYVRAFEVLQRDFVDLLDSIEPADINESTYSYRIHGLLLRACIEVEANFKAILVENELSAADGKLNIVRDYYPLNQSHHLSSYHIKLPVWTGSRNIRKPFEAWSGEEYAFLPWYRAYNETKHSRHAAFQAANLGNLVDAMCGLVTLLSAQFHTMDFSPHEGYVTTNGRDGFDTAIGSYFLVKFPDDWEENELYAFDWRELADQVNPFKLLSD